MMHSKPIEAVQVETSYFIKERHAEAFRNTWGITVTNGSGAVDNVAIFCIYFE